MDFNEVMAFATLAAGVAASYAKTQSDISRLKAEVNMGREREAEATRLMQDLTKTLHRIEKALVKGGLIDIE
jgi:hypothetical protein